MRGHMFKKNDKWLQDVGQLLAVKHILLTIALNHPPAP